MGPINSTQKPDSCQSQLFEINLTSVFRFFLYFSIVRYSRSQFCQLFTYLHIKRITKERRELTPASFYWKVEGRGVAFDSGHLAYPSAQSEWRPLSFFNQNKKRQLMSCLMIILTTVLRVLLRQCKL